MDTIRFHRATGHEEPTDNEGVWRLMQGISRAGRAQRQVRSLTAKALAADPRPRR